MIEGKGHGRSIVIWFQKPSRSSDRRVRPRNSPNSCLVPRDRIIASAGVCIIPGGKYDKHQQ